MTTEKAEPDTLLPCPFCGSNAEFERRGNYRQSSIIACTDCGCRLETGETFRQGEQWNTRAAPPRCDAQSEALREDEYGWLIETGDHKYWNGKEANSNGFTHIADDAVRFARFEDSERIIYWLMESYKVFLVSRQHKFLALSETKPAQGDAHSEEQAP